MHSSLLSILQAFVTQQRAHLGNGNRYPLHVAFALRYPLPSALADGLDAKLPQYFRFEDKTNLYHNSA